MSTISNGILLLGNTGVGKSFVANKIFEHTGSSVRFVSNSSTQSVTSTIQQGTINFKNKTFTIADTPGFFDTTNNSDGNVDNKNMCKLVKALESCEQLYALIFIFTDRFSTPHKIWFERIVSLVTEAHRGNIILLHNKVSRDITDRDIARNEMGIANILGVESQQYFCLTNEASCDKANDILIAATTMSPFQLKNLEIPNICYEKDEQGPEYEEELTKVKKDEGHHVEEIKDTSHYEDDEELKKRMEKELVVKGIVAVAGMAAHGGAAIAKVGAASSIASAAKAGAKGIGRMASQTANFFSDSQQQPKKWVESTATEKKWVPNEVTRRTMVTFVNLYKVRFDGTKDWVAKKEMRRREEIIG